MFENLASFDAANEPCISKEKPKQMYASWFRKGKKEWAMLGEKKHKAEGKWKRAGPLTSRNLSPSLFPSTFLFFPLPLCRISPNPPITVMSGWERGRGGGRERLCVTGRTDGGEGGRYGRRRFITAFYLLWVSLIPWPCADWSVKINSWDQMSGPGVRSVVILTLREPMCGQVGMWIKMEMPLEGCSYTKHLLVVVLPWLNWCTGLPPLI